MICTAYETIIIIDLWKQFTTIEINSTQSATRFLQILLIIRIDIILWTKGH